MEYLKIGKIVNTFGIKGELKVISYSDFNDERYAKDKVIYIYYHDQYLAMTINSARDYKDSILISFKDNNDINLVEKYKNCEVFITKDSLHKLADGEYYFFELKDLDVYDMDNKQIGKVLNVEEGLAHNNLRIQLLNGKKCLVPYVKAFIHKVDIERKKIWIKTIEGLL